MVCESYARDIYRGSKSLKEVMVDGGSLCNIVVLIECDGGSTQTSEQSIYYGGLGPKKDITDHVFLSGSFIYQAMQQQIDALDCHNEVHVQGLIKVHDKDGNTHLYKVADFDNNKDESLGWLHDLDKDHLFSMHLEEICPHNYYEGLNDSFVGFDNWM